MASRRGADHLHAEFFEHALAGQIERAVQRRLAAHGRQQRLRALALDDLLHHLPGDRLDVDGVRHVRVGHDGGRVRVDQHHPVAFLAQRLAGLRAGVVELAGLADHDRPGADDQDGLDVGTFGHGIPQAPRWAAIRSAKRSNRWAASCGPGLASGWPWKPNGRLAGVGDALQRAVEQRPVGGRQTGRQAGLVDREAVVLAGDQHPAGGGFQHRVVGAVVAEFHLDRARAGRQGQQLVAKTDAEQRQAAVQELADGGDGVIAGLRIARPVRQEHAVRIQRQHLRCRRGCRHHGHRAAGLRQTAQDVALDAEVVGHHPKARRGRRRKAIQRPGAAGPFIAAFDADDLGQIRARQTAEGARLRHGEIGVDIRPGNDATGLRPAAAQAAGQRARVQAGDGHHIARAQVGVQRLAPAPAAVGARQITDHQPGGVNLRRLLVVRVAADVADVRIGERHDLPAVRRIGEDFLIAGQGGVEHHLADAVAAGADGGAVQQRAVGEGEKGWLGQDGLRGLGSGAAKATGGVAAARRHRCW